MVLLSVVMQVDQERRLVEAVNELKCSAIVYDIDINTYAALTVRNSSRNVNKCAEQMKLFLLRIGCAEADIDSWISKAIEIFNRKECD